MKDLTIEIIQKNKSHLAVVVDNIKEKNFLGIITLEDILEVDIWARNYVKNLLK